MKTTDEPVGITKEHILEMENKRLKEIIDVQNKGIEEMAGADALEYVKNKVAPILEHVDFLEGENTRLKEIINEINGASPSTK